MPCVDKLIPKITIESSSPTKQSVVKESPRPLATRNNLTAKMFTNKFSFKRKEIEKAPQTPQLDDENSDPAPTTSATIPTPIAKNHLPTFDFEVTPFNS